MSDNSRIEWTDATWNPTTGCTKVSPGCDHCYAEGIFNRFNGPGAFDTVQLRPDRLGQPLRWRKPRRVFVNSMSDLFHEDVPDEHIAQVWAVMATAYPHTFQVLTKRHARMRSLLSSERFVDLFDRAYCAIPDWADRWPDADYCPGNDHLSKGPLSNVWVGVSVEDQKWADIRVPALVGTPAAVRFLSCEPLLGPVSLIAESNPWGRYFIDGIDWVIVGGESGPGARPMHPAWVRALRDECQAHETAFFFKQWGNWRYAVECESFAVEQAMRNDGTWEKWQRFHVDMMWPDGRLDRHGIPEPGVTASMMRLPAKHDAGRTLDGRTWDEYPQREEVQGALL